MFLPTARSTGLLLPLLVSVLVVAQQAAAPPEPEPIIEQIKKCVVFLEGTYSVNVVGTVNGATRQAPQERQLSATGFLIRIPEPRIGPDAGLVYLVTNKHVIREPNASGILGEGPYLADLRMRINTKEPGPDGTQYQSSVVPVIDNLGSLQWFVDLDDETVDLAVTPVAFDPRVLDFKTIQPELFATAEFLNKEKINENDEILFAGLFAWHAGVKKNYPIVRHGKLSLLAKERIPLDRRRPERTVEVYLADVMSFGGNSGSPVFLRVGGIRERPQIAIGGFSYYLLGVMEGFFPEGMEFAVEIAEHKGMAAQNSGIAAVIPVDRILHILDTPRARAYREAAIASHYAEIGNLQSAEKSFAEAIGILERAAPEHSDLAVALEGYARVLVQLKRPLEARIAELHARRIRSATVTDRVHPRM